MRYVTGEIIKIGDIITFADSPGRVVVSIEQHEAVKGYKAEEWAYLKVGIIVEAETTGLVHIEVPDEDLVLVKRTHCNT